MRIRGDRQTGELGGIESHPHREALRSRTDRTHHSACSELASRQLGEHLANDFSRQIDSREPPGPRLGSAFEGHNTPPIFAKVAP